MSPNNPRASTSPGATGWRGKNLSFPSSWTTRWHLCPQIALDAAIRSQGKTWPVITCFNNTHVPKKKQHFAGKVKSNPDWEEKTEGSCVQRWGPLLVPGSRRLQTNSLMTLFWSMTFALQMCYQMSPFFAQNKGSSCPKGLSNCSSFSGQKCLLLWNDSFPCNHPQQTIEEIRTKGEFKLWLPHQAGLLLLPAVSVGRRWPQKPGQWNCLPTIKSLPHFSTFFPQLTWEKRNKITPKCSPPTMVSHGDCNIFFSFYSHTSGIWKFPSQGSNWKCSCSLCSSLWQSRIFNQLLKARDQTCILPETMSGP